MSLKAVGRFSEITGKGRKPTWEDYGGKPKWLQGSSKK